MTFLVFFGDTYYPQGGFKDTHKIFHSKDEALGFAKGVVWDESCKWAHVVVSDMASNGKPILQIVWDSTDATLQPT